MLSGGWDCHLQRLAPLFLFPLSPHKLCHSGFRLCVRTHGMFLLSPTTPIRGNTVKQSRQEPTCRNNWDNRPAWGPSCSLDFRDAMAAPVLSESKPWVIRPRDQPPSVHISFCSSLASFKILPRAASPMKLLWCPQQKVISHETTVPPGL